MRPFLIALVVLSCPALAYAGEIPTAKPADVGMSAEKLRKVDEVMIRLVKQNRLAGGIVAVVRKGKLVHMGTYGQMDREAKKPMRKDTIFRIYSMSKAITSAAVMILVDEGKIQLDAPVSKYIPTFKKLKVYNKDGNTKPEREMTVADLMRHTAGLSYGFSNSPVDQLYKKAGVLNRNNTLEEMCEKIADLPLVYSPGKSWQYSASIDVLGRVVEVASGKAFDEFLANRIFKPLGMKDTGFFVPEEKLARFAANYTSDSKGKLTLRDAPSRSRYLRNPKLFSGGGGLVSTADDYLRFLLMVQHGGELWGKRILSKKSVRLMTTNQLPKGVPSIRFGAPRKGVGHGLGFSVKLGDGGFDPKGRVGEFGWGGAASTHFWVSPKDDLVVVTLEQVMPYSFMTEFAVKGLIYDAIEK